MDRKEGTFIVTAADAESAVFKDVDDGQVHTLSSNPGVEEGEAVDATLASEPPMEVTWRAEEVDDRRAITLEESDESLTPGVREAAADLPVGELTRIERAGDGELHVIAVPEERTAEAVADVLGDEEATRTRAARLGATRVEVRSAPGVVSVRYLP